MRQKQGEGERVLAVDPGDKRTGLAISAGSLAVALPTFSKDDRQRVSAATAAFDAA